jgi:hypothetical protein
MKSLDQTLTIAFIAVIILFWLVIALIILIPCFRYRDSKWIIPFWGLCTLASGIWSGLMVMGLTSSQIGCAGMADGLVFWIIFITTCPVICIFIALLFFHPNFRRIRNTQPDAAANSHPGPE